MDNRAFVKAVQITRPWLRPNPQYFYTCIYYREYPVPGIWNVLNPEDYPTAWGFENINDAQKVCDQYNNEQFNPDY